MAEAINKCHYWRMSWAENTHIVAITQTLSKDLCAAVKEAQIADKDIDMSADVKDYKQAVDSLSVCISACVGPDLLSESADVVVVARELEGGMKAKLAKLQDEEKERVGTVSINLCQMPV